MASRATHVQMAKLYEQAEMYDKMAASMTSIVLIEDNDYLTDEERNLLSVAYKNIVGAKRSAWRIVSSIEQKEKEKNGEKSELAEACRKEIEEELRCAVKEVLDLLDKYLLQRARADLTESGSESTTEAEAVVFYLKMKGDYNRYLVEVAEEAQKEEISKMAKEAYDEAFEVAKRELASTHPIRLGLALNFSVFYYEIKNEPKEACELAKKAFDAAIAEFDHLKEGSYKDSTLIMQLLRDNLTLWTSEEDQGDEEEQ